MPIDTKAIRSSLNGDWEGTTPVERRLVTLLDVVLAELERSNGDVSAQLAANTEQAQRVANLGAELLQELRHIRAETQLLAASAQDAMRRAERAERHAIASEQRVADLLRTQSRERPTDPDLSRYSSKPPEPQ